MPPRVFDLLSYYAAQYGYKDCLFAKKENGKWAKHSVRSVISASESLAMALISMGIEKGDRVAILADSDPRWNIIDFAVLQAGGVVVPIHINIGQSDLKYIIAHCQPKAIFIKDKDLIEKIADILVPFISEERIVSVKNDENVVTFDRLVGMVQDKPLLQEALKTRKESVSPNDIASIIYTSGTSGTPKGVMLSHHNIMTNVAHYTNYVPRIERVVSHLPLSHIFERSIVYARIYCGIAIHYAESQATIIRDVIDIKANSFSTVPRVLERMYDYVVQVGKKKKGLKRKLYNWALDLANNYDETSYPTAKKHPIKFFVAKRTVFKEIRELFGGRLVFISSGGAPLRPQLVKFCAAMDFPIVEGYGLTETSPMISLNRLVHGKIKAGSVGLPCNNLDVKIDETSEEILVKGSSVMMGYYKDEERTKAAFDEKGYFHTGDKGMFDDEGFLFIKGRLSDTFKTSMGKFIVPSVIEATLCDSPFIGKALVVGEGQRYAAALIVPDFQQLSLWCREKGIAFDSLEKMTEDHQIKKLLEQEVHKCNGKLGSAETVRRFKIVNHDWTVESGELTPSLKIRRHFIIDNNKEAIEALFV